MTKAGNYASAYLRLMHAWREVEFGATKQERDAVESILDDARINADDTVYSERAASELDWDRLFIDTVALILSSPQWPKTVVEWFEEQGIRA